MSYEVDRPILSNPFDQPAHYWFIGDGYDPELREGRLAYLPREGNIDWDLAGVLKPSIPEFIHLLESGRSPTSH